VTGERTEQPVIAKAVTLEVNVEDAQKILLAANIGRLSLILRQPAQASNDQVQRVTEQDLGDAPMLSKPIVTPLPTPAVVAPPPPPPVARPVAARTRRITIWHGLKAEEYERPIYRVGDP
jgi:pilus assembly protein CpaB